MLDTIRFSLHGILDGVKDIVIKELLKNKNKSDLFCTAHNSLYLKMLECNNDFFEMIIFKNKETNQYDYFTKEQFLEHVDSEETFLGKSFNSEKERLNKFHYLNYKTMTFVNGKEKKTISGNANGKYKLTSQSSNVTFFLKKNQGKITFELSIPKYLYGHNLAEFIPQCQSKRFQKENFALNQWSRQSRLLYKRLYEFLDIFFIDLMNFFELDEMPDLKFVSIDRLDFCYNQHFETKEEALYYLELQKKIASKVKTNRKQGGTDYDSSIAYKTLTGNFFKIYHKGNEYVSKNGDCNKHKKINSDYMLSLLAHKKTLKHFKRLKTMIYSDYMLGINRKGKDHFKDLSEQERKTNYLSKLKILNDQEKKDLIKLEKLVRNREPIDIKFIKDEADKVLRYEYTIRTNFMRYYHKKYVFRKDCEVHQEFFTNYKRVKKYFDKDMNLNFKLSKYDKKNYELFNKWLCQSPTFWLDGSKYFKSYEQQNGQLYNNLNSEGIYKIQHFPFRKRQNYNNSIFTKELMSFSISAFKKMINKYQIEQVLNYRDIKRQIVNYNLQAKQNLISYNNNSMNLIDMTVQNRKFKEYNNKLKYANIKDKVYKKLFDKPSDMISYSQKQKLNLVGINERNIISVYKYLKTGKSLDEYRFEFELNSSQFCRLKSQLKKFKIYQNSFEVPKLISVKTDFSYYYQFTNMQHYRDKFYNKLLTQNNTNRYE